MQDFSAIRLLILDDDELVRSTIQSIAESSGIQCHCTAAPAEFFAQLESWQPTHISLDLVMPEMDGVEVILELALRQCSARIFITSGISERILNAARRSAHEHGLDVIGALPKPFTASALRTLIRENPPLTDRQPRQKHRSEPAPPITVTEQIIRQALQKNELTVVYQPKVTCIDGSLVGAEALVRWQHPEHGNISPATFIPLAEATGLIHLLTEYVFDQALRWRASFGSEREFILSLNLSALTIAKEAQARPGRDEPSFANRLAEKCLELQVRPSSVILELTESSAMENMMDSLALLTRLRMKGFQLSIEDFGNGFSSMQQLAHLPFSEIKVDQSFITSALQSDESRTIIRSIIGLGQSLGLHVTAEGVEDRQTLQWLKQAGCSQAQGYLIGGPMTPEEFADWMEIRDTHLYSDEQY